MTSDRSIVPTPAITDAGLQTSIAAFNQPLAEFLASLSLPTENVLAPIGERQMVIGTMSVALELLPIADRQKAAYISRFTVAVSAGLFDSALNYLWDETIAALRRLVTSIDLSYFFDIAEKREDYRARLRTADDFEKIDDLTFIDAATRVGVISDTSRERLRHINYMRNHASAAHPTDDTVHGAELVAWLSNCLRYVITAKPDVSVITVRQLLGNLRANIIPNTDVGAIVGEIVKLDQSRIDDFLWTIFGMYTDPTSDANTRSNILNVAPGVWNAGTEDRKYEVGSRLAAFVKNADAARRQAAQEFLTKVGGLQYRSEDLLTIELLDKLRQLDQVHNALNNFYNEWPHAAALKASLPPNGNVPRAARQQWVRTICKCYIGNGLGYRAGVDEAAAKHYDEYIAAFAEPEIVEFVALFADPAFTADMGLPKAEKRAREVATRFRAAPVSVHTGRGLDAILAAPPGRLGGVANTSAFKAAVAAMPKS